MNHRYIPPPITMPFICHCTSSWSSPPYWWPSRISPPLSHPKVIVEFLFLDAWRCGVFPLYACFETSLPLCHQTPKKRPRWSTMATHKERALVAKWINLVRGVLPSHASLITFYLFNLLELWLGLLPLSNLVCTIIWTWECDYNKYHFERMLVTKTQVIELAPPKCVQ